MPALRFVAETACIFSIGCVDQDDHETAQRLSPREAEVLQIAALGLTNTEIAAKLGISVHAVKFHLASSYRKLHAANRTEAVVVYLDLLGKSRAGEDQSAVEAVT